MILKETIKQIIEPKLVEDGYFLVDVSVSAGNNISVHIDSFEGVKVEYCIAISRLVEGSLDREKEDFELEVSSPGIGRPLKVRQQYQKIEGKEVEVLLPSGATFQGVLKSSTDEGFVLEVSKMVKPEGAKKKELQVTEHNFAYSDTKSVKEIIQFK